MIKEEMRSPVTLTSAPEIWVQAIAFGQPVPDLIVSNYGRVRYTVAKNGRDTMPNAGSKAGDEKRLKQMEICVKRPGYKWGYSAINVARVVWESFGNEFIEGNQMDHIDRNVRNNALWNLRCVSRSENMQNRGPIRRRKANEVCPMANDYAYRMRLRYNVTSISKLRKDIRKKYQKMRYQEIKMRKRRMQGAA